MAELTVQPKKRSNILPWLALLLGIAALIWFLTNRNHRPDVAKADTTAAPVASDRRNIEGDWGSVDMNAPALKYDEITDNNINVRGNDQYAIYGLGENILFDEGKATLRQDAEANLKQITGSIDKRYKGGDVRVYGYTDAQGSAGSNKELAQQRADAVKAWLQNNGIEGTRITVNAIGEGQPVASNSTDQGRQQNRRVEIVARSSK